MMRVARIVTVALSVISLATAPVAAQAADSPSVPARVASQAENPEHLSKNALLILALLGVTVAAIFLARSHGGQTKPVSP